MPVTALPTPPSRSDPANFAARADAFHGALPTFATELNALQSDVATRQSAVATNATAAAASATAAQAAQAAAEGAAMAQVWVSGTNYTAGQQVYSPTNNLNYRCIVSISPSTVDPIADSTHWGSSTTGMASLAGVETLTNKTMSGANNTFSNIPVAAVPNAMPKAGSTFTGSVGFQAAAGTTSIYNGTGDGASYATHNTRVHLHYGLGFEDYLGICRGVYDARTGVWDVKGGYRIDGIPVPNAYGTGASGTWNINTTGNSATSSKAATLANGGGAGAAMTFNWSGLGGTPPYVWGGSDGANMYVYSPSNFSVNYANTAGSSGYATSSGTTGYISPAQVGGAIVNMAVYDLGAYVMAKNFSGAAQGVGTVLSGSLLQAADGTGGASGATLPGTWRLNGWTGSLGVSLWVRVA